MLILGGCCKMQEYKKAIIDNNTILFNRLEIIPKPLCKTNTYSDIVECLLKYKQALDQSNEDKSEILNNLKEKDYVNTKKNL